MYVGLGSFDGVVEVIPESVAVDLEFGKLIPELLNFCDFFFEGREGIVPFSLSPSVEFELFSFNFFLV